MKASRLKAVQPPDSMSLNRDPVWPIVHYHFEPDDYVSELCFFDLHDRLEELGQFLTSEQRPRICRILLEDVQSSQRKAKATSQYAGGVFGCQLSRTCRFRVGIHVHTVTDPRPPRKTPSPPQPRLISFVDTSTGCQVEYELPNGSRTKDIYRVRHGRLVKQHSAQ